MNIEDFNSSKSTDFLIWKSIELLTECRKHKPSGFDFIIVHWFALSRALKLDRAMAFTVLGLTKWLLIQETPNIYMRMLITAPN